MSTTPGFVDDYLAYLLARASHLMSSEFHAVVEAEGLTLMEWRVMASLSGKDSLSINELAGIVLAKQPTVTKLVGRMQEAGWVRRVDAAHDKRQSLVSLTTTGRRKVRPLLQKAKAHEAQVVSAIGQEQAHQLKGMLERLIGGYGGGVRENACSKNHEAGYCDEHAFLLIERPQQTPPNES